jgi:disulfide bond formation protein DsbB
MQQQQQSPAAAEPSIGFSLLGLIAAGVTCAGSLYLSLGMGLTACPLCFYQRSFAFAAAGVLLLGIFSGTWRSGTLNLLALFCSVSGLLVAAWHSYLVWEGKLICPPGINDIRSAPEQSLAAFAITSLLLLLGCAKDVARNGLKAFVVALAVIAAAGVAYGCVKSSPKPVKLKEPNPLTCHPPIETPQGELRVQEVK